MTNNLRNQNKKRWLVQVSRRLQMLYFYRIIYNFWFTLSHFFPFCIIKLGLVEKWKGSSILQQRFLAGVGMVEKIANFPVCDTNGKKWTEERKSIGEKSSRVCTTHNSINYCVIAWRVSIILTYSHLNSYFDFHVCLSFRPSSVHMSKKKAPFPAVV